MAWTFESMYFGHGGMPDEAIWRTDGIRREVRFSYGILQESPEACRKLWEKNRTPADSEPTMRYVDQNYWSVSWWVTLAPEAAEKAYELDVRDGWGGAKIIDNPDRGLTPL